MNNRDDAAMMRIAMRLVTVMAEEIGMDPSSDEAVMVDKNDFDLAVCAAHSVALTFVKGAARQDPKFALRLVRTMIKVASDMERMILQSIPIEEEGADGDAA